MRRALPFSMVALAVAIEAGSAGAADKLVGLNVHQSVDVGLPVTVDCVGPGAIVRMDFNWFDIEASEGAYDWTLFDSLVDGAVAKNLTVLAVVSYTPAWASSANTDGKTHDNDVPIAGKYEVFVGDAVARYGDRVKHWELWNEPNLGQFWEGTPQQYVDLILKPGAAAVHAKCADCKTLAPDVATLAAGKYDVWMQTVLTQGKDLVDVVSGHVYSDFPADLINQDPTAISFFTKLEKHRVLKIGDTVVYEDPLSLRESMVKYGAADKPFWLTETGTEAALGDAKALDAQKTYARHALEAMLLRPWWQATVYYEAFDEPAGSSTFGFALHDGTPPRGYQTKPVCALVQKAIAQQPALGGTGTDCSDGLDNDWDGLIDLDDPACFNASTKSEGAMPLPDAGADTDEGSGGDADLDAASQGDGGGGGGCGCATANSVEIPAFHAFSAMAALAFAVRRRRRVLAEP